MASRDASGVANSICLAKQADLEAVAFSCTGRRLARAAYGLGFRVRVCWGNSSYRLRHPASPSKEPLYFVACVGLPTFLTFPAPSEQLGSCLTQGLAQEADEPVIARVEQPKKEQTSKNMSPPARPRVGKRRTPPW